jgi:hypothetical protein
MTSAINRNGRRYALWILQALVGLTAILGGGQLAADPTGQGAGLPIEWLSGSPFPDYRIPGLVLLLVVGGSATFGALAAFLRSPQAGRLAVASGLLLLGFIGVEVGVVGWRTVLQPLYLLQGLVILGLGGWEAWARGLRSPVSEDLDRGWRADRSQLDRSGSSG